MHYKKLKNCGMIFVSLRATSMRNRNIKNMVVAGKHDISWNILRAVCSYVAKTLSLEGGGGGGWVSRSKLPNFLNSLFTLPKSNFWNLVWFSHEYIQSAGVPFRERIYQGMSLFMAWNGGTEEKRLVKLSTSIPGCTRSPEPLTRGPWDRGWWKVGQMKNKLTREGWVVKIYCHFQKHSYIED